MTDIAPITGAPTDESPVEDLETFGNLRDAGITSVLETIWPGIKDDHTVDEPQPVEEPVRKSDLDPDPSFLPNSPEEQEEAEQASPGGPIRTDPLDPDPAYAPNLPERGPTAEDDGWVTLPNGMRVSLQRMQDIMDLDRRAMTAPQAPAPAPPPAPQLPALPQLSEDDLADPAVRALYQFAQQQQQALAATNQRATEAARLAITQSQQENGRLVHSTVTQFQTQFNLPDEIMAKVQAQAARTNVIPEYMKGLNVLTGERVDPDAARAVYTSLEAAYWQVPDARNYEFKKFRERDAATLARKQRTAGVGGSSGSAPRNPVREPQTAEDMRQMAIQEVAAAMGVDN